MTSSPKMEQIGSILSVGRRWSDETGSVPGPCDSYTDVDRELCVTVISDPPYTDIRRLSNGSYHYEGYLFDIWEIIARELNLRYRIEPLFDGGYGNLHENGTWSGMVGELAYRRADVSLSWAFIRADRATVVDFIDSVAVERSKETFYIPQSSGEMPNFSEDMFRSLLKPLDVNVWWTLIVFMFVLSIVLRLSLCCNHAGVETSETVEDLTWGSCLLSSFMSLVGQGWARIPDSLAARTVTIFSWVLGIVIYTSYTTNLISHLTAATVERPISSLEEFSKRSDWTLAMQPGHGVLNDWKISRDRHLRGLFERTASGEGFLKITTTPENILKLAQPKVMAYASRAQLLSVMGNHACRMVPLQENAGYQTGNGFLMMAKGMPKLHAAINDLLMRLHELGVLWRLKSQWLPAAGDRNECEQVVGSRALTIGEFLPVLAVIGPGLVISVILLIAEWGWVKFSRAHKRS